MDLKISKGENEAQLKSDVTELLKMGWKLDKECIQLEKTYNFKTYTKVAVSKTPQLLLYY
jgi:pterin-4a-carbinolamine dehydratase